ncbi:hypothetical protein KEM55_007328 [Ascosphaera atra]|nr:hypothetical protein KEM55_007328 [Ascosphaera atra]
MSIRVVARVRPLLESERQSDVIVRTGSAARSSPARRSLPNSKRKLDAGSNDCENIIKIPSQRSEAEEFSFQFNAVYDSNSTQQELFDAEGTGKTHTMRGGESLEQRGVIPRLLNGIYRRSKKLESDDENVNVQVLMSYYEIYNDKVFDLFEPPEKRSPMGLPLRDAGGKTTVVGLTEKPCNNLRSFEELYDQGNENRSTGATKVRYTRF